MIFPLLVLGSPGAQWMTSGVAIGPITLRTVSISCFFSAAASSGG